MCTTRQQPWTAAPDLLDLIGMAQPILAAVGFSKLLWVAAPHSKCESCDCEMHSHSSMRCVWGDGSSKIGSACHVNLCPKKAKSKVYTIYTSSMVWPSLSTHTYAQAHHQGRCQQPYTADSCLGDTVVHLWWPGTLNTLLKLGKTLSNLSLETMHIKSKNNKVNIKFYCILQLN